MKSIGDFDEIEKYRNYLIDYYSGLFLAQLMGSTILENDKIKRMKTAVHCATMLAYEVTKKYE